MRQSNSVEKVESFGHGLAEHFQLAQRVQLHAAAEYGAVGVPGRNEKSKTRCQKPKKSVVVTVDSQGCFNVIMGVGRGAGGSRPLVYEIWFFAINFSVQNVFLLVSRWQNEISPRLAPWKKSFGHPWKNPLLTSPLEKNSTDAHECSTSDQSGLGKLVRNLRLKHATQPHWRNPAKRGANPNVGGDQKKVSCNRPALASWKQAGCQKE